VTASGVVYLLDRAGPDGELYVGVMGLLSLLAIDDRPDLGLVRFSSLPAE